MLVKMASIAQSNAPDAFIPDLEDSVPYASKHEAREILGRFLREELGEVKRDTSQVPRIASNRAILIPRVNSEPEYFHKDLKAILSERVYAITVGKTDSEDDVKRYHQILTEVEREKGLEENSIRLIPTIESALALQNIQAILASVPLQRLFGVAFGADDYASDMGFTRDTEPLIRGQFNSEFELEHVRHCIGVAARAVRMQAFDTPNVNFKHEDQHRREATAVRRMGFTGKFAIHPNQIAVLNEMFGVTRAQYDEAVKVVEAYEKAVRENSRGSLQIDGRMVDQPVLKQYQNVISRWDEQQQ